MTQKKKSKNDAPTTNQERRAPQQQRSLDRIETILAATELAIAEGGYDNLRIVEIARRAGITHTSIYQYFHSIEMIVETLISRYMGDFQSKTEALISTADSPDDLIAALVGSIYFAYEVFRSKPAARGLWIATRYLPALRKIDEEENLRIARAFRDRLKVIAPQVDANAAYIAALTTASLTTAACELALSVPPQQRLKVMNQFVEMVKLRFADLIATTG